MDRAGSVFLITVLIPLSPPLSLHTHNDSPPPLPAGEIVSIELPSRDFPLQDY